MTIATNPPHEQIAARVNQFIRETFLFGRHDLMLTNDLRLIEQAVIDSLGIFQMLSFLEEEFHMTVEPESIVLENFETINAIAAMVADSMLVKS